MKKAGSWLLICITVLFLGFLAGIFVGRNVFSEALPDNTFLIPAPQSAPMPTGTQTESNEIHEWRVNINTASVDELDLLPGIGPSIAQRIVDYRTEFGPFTQIMQLANVKGIGEATVRNLKDYVILEDTQ